VNVPLAMSCCKRCTGQIASALSLQSSVMPETAPLAVGLAGAAGRGRRGTIALVLRQSTVGCVDGGNAVPARRPAGAVVHRYCETASRPAFDLISAEWTPSGKTLYPASRLALSFSQRDLAGCRRSQAGGRGGRGDVRWIGWRCDLAADSFRRVHRRHVIIARTPSARRVEIARAAQQATRLRNVYAREGVAAVDVVAGQIAVVLLPSSETAAGRSRGDEVGGEAGRRIVRRVALIVPRRLVAVQVDRLTW